MLRNIFLSCLFVMNSYSEELNMLQVKEIIINSYYKVLPDSVKKLPWNEFKKHLDKYTKVLNNNEREEFERSHSNKLDGAVGIFIDSCA